MSITVYAQATSEENLFAAALDLPPDQRPAFLDQACGSDGGLRRRIEALLKANEEAGDLLEPPVIEIPDSSTSTPATDEPNPRSFLAGLGLSTIGGATSHHRCAGLPVRNATARWDMGVFRAWKLAFFLVVGLGFFVSPAWAQWQNQTFTLKPGWNAIFLHVDASHQTLDDLVPNASGPIADIWLWKPRLSTMQYVSSPATNFTGNSQWAVWTSGRGDTDTLTRLVANGAYLVNNRSTVDFVWTVKGKPVPPSYRWTTTGLNFLGFPTPTGTAPNFSDYFAPASGLDFAKRLENNVRVFRYVGGDLGAANPVEVVSLTASSVSVNRGEAFWVRGSTNYYNRYYGPVEVSLQSDAGIHFGETLGTYSLRLKNLTTSSRTVSFSFLDSENPPSGQSNIVAKPQLLVRGSLSPTNLTYSHAVLAGQSFTLTPQGEEGSQLEVVLGLNRTAMSAAAGSLYAGILRISDTGGLQEVYVPVSATVPNSSGLWVGQATVDRVGQYLKQYPKADTNASNDTAEIDRVAGEAGVTVKGAEVPGSDWIARELGVNRNYGGSAMSLDGRRVYTAVFGGSLYISTDFGAGLSTNGMNGVRASGFNNLGQTLVPANVGAATAMAGGDEFSLALRADGVVVAWGGNNYGQINVPAGLNGVTAIAAGFGHSLARKSDGTVVAWGLNNAGQASVPSGLSGVIGVSAGREFSLALKSDGTVTSWGNNSYGQRNIPAIVTNVTAIAAGGYHAVALRTNGTVVSWGWHPEGQTNVPAGLTNVIAIAAGERHSLALKSDGTVVAWGGGAPSAYGQATVPGGLINVRAIAAGQFHSLALLNDGTVVRWGRNDRQQLNLPSNLGAVTGIAAGGSHNLYLVQASLAEVDVALGATFRPGGPNRALAWGGNASGQTNAPASAAAVAAVAGGDAFSVALRADGTVVAWGLNTSGQTNVPAGLSGVTAISAGLNHSLALKSDGTVAAWGANNAGQANVPSGLSGVIAVAAGGEGAFSVALKSDRTVTSWGGNSFGQRTIPASLSNVTAIAAGGYHGVALRNNGTVVSWGWNGEGQTNTPAGLSGVIAIAAGERHSMALKGDGTVVAWGTGTFAYGQTNVPAGLTGVKSIAAGRFHSLALKNDGTVVGWGRNDAGQVNIPGNLGVVTGIAGGGSHSLAVGGFANLPYTSIACSGDGSVVAATVWGGQIFVSTDYGATWASRGSTLNWSGIAASGDGKNMAASAWGNALYTSTDYGRTWVPRLFFRNWSDIASSGDGSRLVAAVYNGSLYTSADYGVNWTYLGVNGLWKRLESSVSGSNLVAVAYNGRIHVSTNAGLNWIARESNRAWTGIASSSDGQRLTATVENGAVYVSLDGGVTWTSRSTSRNWLHVSSSADASRLVAVVFGGQIYTLSRQFADYVMEESGLVRDQSGRYLSSGVVTNMARVANTLPLRLILHRDATADSSSLLQRVYVGQGATTTNLVIANQERWLNSTNIASARRISATHLPFSQTNTVWNASGGFANGGSLTFSVPLDYNDHVSNPFLHTFHPDHDNLDPLFKRVRPVGEESYGITRSIKLSFQPAGSSFSALTANAQARSGVYEETITVTARAGATREFRLSGSFSLQRISPVSTLTTQ
jgi:alpha-tubulin suppressor-like RCC1 family protein